MNKPWLLNALIQLPILLFGQTEPQDNQIETAVVVAAENQPVFEGEKLALTTIEGLGNSATINPTEPSPQIIKIQFSDKWNMGFGLALAQPSFTVGHPSDMGGYYSELVNSTLMPSVNLGRMVSKGNLNLLNCNLMLSYLNLKEDDRYDERGAAFDIKMAEVLAISDIYVLNLLRPKSARTPKALPFLRFGIGFGIGDYTIINGNTEPKAVNFALPIGFGLRWELSPKTGLVFDYMSRVTFSDSLDGLTSPFGKNDWYGSGGIGLSFRLGRDEEPSALVENED